MFVIQFIVLLLLTAVTFYGGSFILDMMFRRWWINLIVYIIVIGYFILKHGGVAQALYIPFAVSIICVALASISIRYLRKRGYRLFQ